MPTRPPRTPERAPHRTTALVALGALATSCALAACSEEQLGKVLPKIVVEPAAVDLGATPLGVLAKHRVTVKNAGSGALSLESIALVHEEGVPESPDLALELDATLPTTLVANGALELDVRHLPKDDLLDSGVLRVTSNDPAAKTVDVPIGQSALGAPRVAAVPDLGQADAEADLPSGVTSTVAAIALGTVGVGETKTSELWVVNAGTGNVPLRVSDVSLQGGSTAGLRVSADPDPGASRLLLPMIGSASRAASVRSVHVTVTWTPAARGVSLDAVLRISSSDPARRELLVPITGATSMADPPRLRLDPASGLVFTGVTAGASASQSFTAHNDGGSDLVVQPLALGTNPGAAFALGEAPAVVTIAPGQSHTYAVTFAPPGPQAYSGTLELTTNDPARANPIPYALSGNGTSAACTPSTPDPGEPANDTCASGTSRGSIALPANQTQNRTWSDAMLYGPTDEDWSTLVLTVDSGCFLVGYDITATATLPSGEQAEVCVQTGDCGSPTSSQCGTGQARLLVFPGDDVCNAFNNMVPIHVRVRHTGGEPTCTNYTLSFTAR